jgi:hypothetical protein
VAVCSNPGHRLASRSRQSTGAACHPSNVVHTARGVWLAYMQSVSSLSCPLTQTRHRAPLRLRSICSLIGKKGKHGQSLQVPDIKSLRSPIKFSPSKHKQQSTHQNKSITFSLAEFYYPRSQSIRSYLLQDAIHYPRRSTGFQVGLFAYPPQNAL